MSVILATAGYDHKIRFWEAPSGICSRILKYPDSQVNKLEITPDKQFLAAGGNPHIRLYEIAASMPNPSPSSSAQVGGQPNPGAGGSGGGPSQGGPVSAGQPSQSQAHHQQSSTQQPVLTLEGHTSSVTSLGFQRDGRYLFSGSEDGTIKLWDLRNPTYSRSFDAKAPVRSVTLRVDRDEIISGDSNGMVKIWDLGGSGGSRSGSSSSNNNNNHTSVNSSNGGAPLPRNGNPAAAAAASKHNGNNRTGNNMNTRRGNHSSSSSSQKNTGLIHQIQPGDGYTGGCLIQTSIQAVDISEDSRTLVAVSNHGTVYVWDPRNLDNKTTNNHHPAASSNGIDYDYDPSNPHEPESTNHQHYNTQYGNNDYYNGNNNVNINSNNGYQYQNNQHQSSQGGINMNNNGYNDNNQYLKPHKVFRAHGRPGSYCLHAKISPDCRHLCTTGSDGSAKLWDTRTWQLSQNLQEHSKWVWDAAFCADSSYLVTASSDATARLWNLRTGEVVRQYHGHQSAVTCVALNDCSV